MGRVRILDSIVFPMSHRDQAAIKGYFTQDAILLVHPQGFAKKENSHEFANHPHQIQVNVGTDKRRLSQCDMGYIHNHAHHVTIGWLSRIAAHANLHSHRDCACNFQSLLGSHRHYRAHCLLHKESFVNNVRTNATSPKRQHRPDTVSKSIHHDCCDAFVCGVFPGGVCCF